MTSNLVENMVLSECGPDTFIVAYPTNTRDVFGAKLEVMYKGVHYYAPVAGTINKSDFPNLKGGVVTGEPLKAEILNKLIK